MGSCRTGLTFWFDSGSNLGKTADKLGGAFKLGSIGRDSRSICHIVSVRVGDIKGSRTVGEQSSN